MRVAVTGSSGFVGRAVVARLMREPGVIVRALAREPAGGPAAHEVVRCPDLRTGTAAHWQHALEGADVAIHLAARLPWQGDDARAGAYDDFARPNRNGALAVSEGLAAAGGQRLVFLSSIGVNGIVSGSRPFGPDDPPAPAGNYARSKWAAETALREQCRRDGLELVIVRAPIVYGPGVSGKFRALVDAVTRRRPLPFGGLRNNRRDLLGVSNLADFLTLAARHPQAPGGVYLVCDGEPLSTAALIEAIAEAHGVEPRLLTVPDFVVRLAAALPGAGPLVARLLGDVRIDDAAARDRLGWQPPVPVRDELRRLARAGTGTQPGGAA